MKRGQIIAFAVVGMLLGPSDAHEKLIVTPPARFTLLHEEKTDGDLLLTEWRSDTGEVLEVMCWPEGPQLDRGPMVVDAAEPVSLAGSQTQLIWTKVFFGNNDEAWVVNIQREESVYVIYGKNISKTEFLTILGSVGFEQ